MYTSLLQSLATAKEQISEKDVFQLALSLNLVALSSSDSLLRYAGGEGLGHLAKACKKTEHVTEIVQKAYTMLQTSRDVNLRTGYSLALGYLHRHLGAVGAREYTSHSVALLIALAKDTTSSICQVRVM